MAKETEPLNVARVLYDLQRMREMHPLHIPEQNLGPRLEQLRTWQSQRLANTYADLLSEPQFAPAGKFFLSDVYAARDLSQRDRDFERLHEMLARLLPAHMLRLLKSTISLNRLSNALDQQLVDAIFIRMGAEAEITPDLYSEGYRICNNYEARRAQINFLVDILHEVAVGSQLPLVGLTLRIAHSPARRLGWIELHDFLMRGYTAFKQIHEVDRFVNTIEKRETRILDAIFTGESGPFVEINLEDQ